MAARKIRNESGFSCSELVEMLGLGKYKSAANVIYRYEIGQIRPMNPPKTKTSEKYVNWLKEKGYNPFKL